MYRTKQQTNYFELFINSIQSPFTKRTYVNGLELYLKYIGVSDPNLLISEKLETQPKEIRKVEDKLIGYISYLQNENQLSHATVHTRICAILHFYSINRIDLNRRYIFKFIQRKKRARVDTAYTREQIHIMLDNCSQSQKVIILLLASTGMRVGSLPQLDLSCLKPIKVGNQILYKITVYSLEQEEYYTFCSFECAKAIDEYLEYRKRFGEKLGPNSPLIRKRFDNYNPDDVKNPQPLLYYTFGKLMQGITTRSGVRQRRPKKEGQQFKQSLHPVKLCHGFRKFTITQMIKAKLDYGAREYLVGHRHSRGLDENYDRTTVEDRLQEYLKAVDLLTISNENRLQQKVEQLTLRPERLEELEKRMNELDKRLGLE